MTNPISSPFARLSDLKLYIEDIMRNGSNAYYDLHELQPLVVAANSKDITTCRSLLTSGYSLDGWPHPLLNAVVNGLEAAVETLLELGCDVNRVCLEKESEKCQFSRQMLPFIPIMQQMTYLHAAVFVKNIKILTMLLEAGCDPTKSDRFNRTPLHWACMETGDNTDVFDCLLKFLKPADIHCKNNQRQYAIDVAILNRKTEVVKLLIKHGALKELNPLDQMNITASAVVSQKEEILVAVLRAGCLPSDPLYCGRTAIEHTPLYIAIKLANTKLVQLLIEAKALTFTPINDQILLTSQAVKSQNEEILLALLNRGCMADRIYCSFEDRPLNTAIISGNTKFVSILLDFGALLNNCDKTGAYPIHIACIASPSVLEYLLKKGVDVNQRAKDESTALIRFCCDLHKQVDKRELTMEFLRLLTSNGAKLNLVNSLRGGESAFLAAGQRQKDIWEDPQTWYRFKKLQNDVMCHLISEGAIVPPMKWDLTLTLHPLFAAVLTEEKPLVELMIEAGGYFPLAFLDRFHGIISRPFEDWLKNVVSTPRSLYSACRLAVRKQLLLASDDQAIGERVGCLCLPRQRSLLFDDEILCVLKMKDIDDRYPYPDSFKARVMKFMLSAWHLLLVDF